MNNRHTISVSKYNGGSNIPLRKQLSRQSSSPINPSKTSTDPAQRWKQKYEESEEKRKVLLSEKEKALRSLNELEKKHLHLQDKNEHLETELFVKNEEFAKLSTASKNLYKEYETLKNQYETETGAMARALKDATQWYKENKALKRKTLLLVDKDTVDEGVDADESSSDGDIENLNKTIKQLSTEVAELQTELDLVRNSEFQTTEQNIKLSEDVESANANNKKLQTELEELKNEHQQLLRVSDMMKKELEDLRQLGESQRNDIVLLKKEAGEQKRERKILAHQSTLLLQGLDDTSSPNSLLLLLEIENLKRTLEDERNRHEDEMNSLQERLEDEDNDSHIEILEERLKLVEAELQAAIARAEAAEHKLKPPPIAPPPPPPPPPPLIATDSPPVVPLRRRRSRATVEDLAKTIGVAESNEKKPSAPGVNEDIINAIKEGKFTLRKPKKESNNKEKDTPKAVSELLNILGSLRRAPKKRQSQYLGDVQL